MRSFPVASYTKGLESDMRPRGENSVCFAKLREEWKLNLSYADTMKIVEF